MLAKCAKVVRAAAKEMGREGLTDSDLKSIDDRMNGTMKRLSRSDPEWSSYTQDMRVSLSAEQIISDIKAEAQHNADKKIKQVLASANTTQRVNDLQAAYKGPRAKALRREFELAHLSEGSIRRTAQGELMDMIVAAGDKEGVGLGRGMLMTVFDAENPKMTMDIAAEVYKNADGHTGNNVAQSAARAWLDTIDKLRTRFNSAGGDIGKLEYGYIPQPHNRDAISKAGKDAWVDKTLPLLDRSRYVMEDGSRMVDSDVRDFLGEAWKTITTDGLNKKVPGQFTGSGSRANRGSDNRQIHFADGQAWSSYMQEFGQGTLYDGMMRHLAGISKDIALVERYGPDSNATARLQFDLTAIADGRKTESLTGPMTIDPKTYWKILTGQVGAPVDETLANGFKISRDIQSGSKLGAALFSSLADLGTLALTAGYNRLPYWQLVKNISAQSSKETRDWMTTHGMIGESLVASMNRWSGDNIGNGWSGRLANSVMKLSGLAAWSDGLRQGFELTMNAKLGELSRIDWNNLSGFDRSRFNRSSISESEWKILNTIPLDNFKGRELLTPQTIADSGHPQLAEKIFGFIKDDGEYAIVNPDLKTQAIMTFGGQQAGTWGGELARTVMQFKSFPIAMFTRHWARMLEGDHGADGAPLLANRATYAFAMMASLTGLGALSVQAKQILQGKDPIDMESGRFWAKALAQGGALSIAGDLLLVDPAGSPGDSATNAIKNLAGPVIGSAFELAFRDIVENIWQASEGKDTHWQAELLSTIKSNIPGPTAVWWVKPFIDHGFMNAMNESMSPGYLSRMKQNAYKNWKQRFWWAPNETLPSRAPDLSAALP